MIKKTTTAIFKDGEYAGEYDWQDLFGQYPAAIIACDSPTLELRLYRQAGRVEDEAANGQKFYTTTALQLKALNKPSGAILIALKHMPDSRIALNIA